MKHPGGPNPNHVTSWWLPLDGSGSGYITVWVDATHMQGDDRAVLISDQPTACTLALWWLEIGLTG